MEKVDIFFGLLEYITAIWYILWSFANLVASWYIFPRFCKLVSRKIWQPWSEIRLATQHNLLNLSTR
jgi:hypothetical protein